MKIEKLFRDRKIVAMFCTSTLVEGVNLPADNLFITTYRKGRGQTKMTAVDFRNLVGRVGRINYNLYGNVFLVRLEENLRLKILLSYLKRKSRNRNSPLTLN
jgi:replicative superfamily II helicase